MALLRIAFPAAALILAASSAPAQEPEDELPLGFETVTGYRSDYLYRGFNLASHVLDVQLQGEVALSNEWLLNVGGWYATGADSFSETSGFLDLSHQGEGYSIAFSATYHRYDHAFFEDGLDLGAAITWKLIEDLDLTFGGYYDTGSEGFYGKAETAWSKPLGEKSFLSALVGVGLLSDYYGRSGFGDFYTRLAYTYTIDPRISVTPFVGSSFALDSHPGSGDHVFAGLWFEVNF